MEKLAQYPLHVRLLRPADAEVFRAIRFEGLRQHPDAFGTALEDEATKPLDWFAKRLAEESVFAACRDYGILGVLGYRRFENRKQRHIGGLWGMYIRPEARGLKAGDLLLRAAITHARDEVEVLHLAVGAHNERARQLYRRHGFVQYGLEEKALKVGERYFDEVLMRRVLRP